MQDIELPGVILRTACFEPTFHKWAGELCRGFQLHVTDRQTFKPYYTTLALLAVIRELYPEQFAWRQPPYEYETERLPIDLLTGDDGHPRGLENGLTAAELEAAWQEDLGRFMEVRREFLLYPDSRARYTPILVCRPHPQVSTEPHPSGFLYVTIVNRFSLLILLCSFQDVWGWKATSYQGYDRLS